MKTKVYKLAAQLGVREDKVLDWLRSQGYPHMRRADMVRAELVAAATAAFKEAQQGTHLNGRNPQRSTQFTSERDTAVGFFTPSKKDTLESTGTTLKSSFAELLGQHLEAHPNAKSLEGESRGRRVDGMQASMPKADKEREPDHDILKARLRLETQAYEDKYKVLEAELRSAREEMTLLRREIESSREVVLQNAKLHGDVQRLGDELRVVRTKLGEVEHERTTLDTTCASLQARLDVMEAIKSDFESLEMDHSSVVTDLEATQQREVAWRARALELERASQRDGVAEVLSSVGAESLRMKQNLFTGLLGSDKTALLLLQLMEKLDASGLQSILKQHTKSVCVNLLCRKCVARQGKIPILTDDEASCEICLGNEERRFFEGMVCEALGAGIRRIIVYGAAPELKSRLLKLSEGHHVDLRLLDRETDISQARAEGRVDGCDCVVSWAQHALEPNPYLDAAKRLKRLWIMVNSSPSDLAGLARQVTCRLARYSHLATD